MWTLLFLLFVLSAGLFLWERAGKCLIDGLGEAPYTVLWHSSEYEIRTCAAFVVAEVFVPGNVEEAMSEGFSVLSSYVARIGGEEGDHSVAALPTVPDGVGHVVSFALPDRYRSENLPEPDDAGIVFRVVPERVVAALRFRGIPSESRIATKEALLRKFLERDRRESSGDGEAEFVRLAPPYSMPFSATNEIIVPLKA